MSAANGGVDSAHFQHFNPTKPFYVDGLICWPFVLSGSSLEPDNTNDSKSNHQHKEVSGRQVENAQPDLRLGP